MDLINRLLGIEDKVQLVIFGVFGVIILIVGFILGSYMGNPEINLYITRDGKVENTRVWGNEQPENPQPTILKDSGEVSVYPEGSTSVLSYSVSGESE